MALLHRHKMGAIDILVVDAAPVGITAPIGSRAYETNGRIWLNTDGATTWSDITFSRNLQMQESVARSTTTLTTFQSKVALTTGAITGVHRVGWMAVVDHSAVVTAMEARCYNLTDAALVGGLAIYEPPDIGNMNHIGGFAHINFTGAAKTFQIQYRVQVSGTAGISDARIEIWRVG